MRQYSRGHSSAGTGQIHIAGSHIGLRLASGRTAPEGDNPRCGISRFSYGDIIAANNRQGGKRRLDISGCSVVRNIIGCIDTGGVITKSQIEMAARDLRYADTYRCIGPLGHIQGRVRQHESRIARLNNRVAARSAIQRINPAATGQKIIPATAF